MKQNKTTAIKMTATKIARKVLLSCALIALIAVTFQSCKPTLSVSSDYDHSADFTSYKTFSIYDLKTKGNVNQLNRDRIEKYIRLEMTRKGFTESNNKPELMINVVTVLKDQKFYAANTNYYGYGGVYRPYAYWGIPAASYTTLHSYNYKDGSLVIDIVDARTKKMIWQGTGNAQIDKRPKNPDETIREVVAKILEDFPAAQ